MRDAVRAIVFVAMMSLAAFANAQQQVTSGGDVDYQPAVIRANDGARIVVFERLDASTLFGDLWITRSTDGGDTWSDPVAVLATSANERHPALVETAPSEFSLFYLKGQSAASSFRIYRATSGDGVAFAEQGPIDLGWATGGEINPHVIRHADGTLTMSYQRLGGGAGVYVAESNDDGVTWDTQQTQLAASAQLPRIAFRESDGLYLATYQTGSTALHLHVKTSTNVHDWSAPARDFAATGNNHDSLPVVMPEDAFVVFYIREAGTAFDVAFRRSLDGVAWADAVGVTDTPSADDVEPHPLVGDSPYSVELYWGHRAGASGFDYDIVRESSILVADDTLFTDGFDAQAFRAVAHAPALLSSGSMSEGKTR